MLKGFFRSRWHSLLLTVGLLGLTLPAPAAPVVQNNSFETPLYSSVAWPGYTAVDSWTAAGGNPGVNDKTGPFISGAIPADGAQAGFLQGPGATTYQDVAGFEAGKQYIFTYYEIGREADTSGKVQINGADVIPDHTMTAGSAGAAMDFKTAQFASPGAGTFRLEIFNTSGAGDHTINFDDINIIEVGSPAKISAPANLAFGLSGVKLSAMKTISIVNGGGSALNVSSLAISGTDAADFSIGSPTGSFSIPAATSQPVNVIFTASKASTETATLTINSNAPNAAALTVTLSGVGIQSVAHQWNPYPCYKAPQAPVIDGTLSPNEWQSEPIVMTKAMMQMFGGMVNGGAQINSDADLSGTYYLMWDDNYLYLGAHVKDSTPAFLLDQGGALNATDGVQLCLDYNNTGAAMNADDSVTIHDVVPGQKSDNTKAAYWQHWSKTYGNEAGYPTTFPNSKFAGHKTSDGYEVELAIKWSDCSNFTGPKIGQIMGYMTMLMDFDASGNTVDLWWNAPGDASVIGNAAKWNKLVLCDELNPPQQWNPYIANKAITPPVIDGVISPNEYRTSEIIMTQTNMKSLGGSAANNYANTPTDADLSGRFWITWDKDYLYIGAHVYDSEVVYLLNQGGALNATDGIQLCLDYNNTGAAANADDSVTIHDVVPGQAQDPTTAGYWQHWSKTQGNEAGYPKTFPNSKFAGRTVPGGYECELAIKWTDCSNFNGPSIGQIMGYMTMLMDFGSADPSAALDLWWNAGSGNNVIGDASQWNKLKLADSLDGPPNAAHEDWTTYQ